MARVLLVGKGAPDHGGIAAFIDMLLESELSTRHRLEFLNVAHGEDRQGGRMTFANVRRTLADFVAVWRASRSSDVVHIQSALSPGVTVLRAGVLAAAGRLGGARVILHGHGGNVANWLTGTGRRAFVRLALQPVGVVIAVSDDVRRALLAAAPHARVEFVANGVDVDRFTPGAAENDPPRVLHVGVLTPRKGVLDLITASRRLRHDGVRHELWLAGGAPDEGGAAEREVRSAAADGVARILDVRTHDEMPALYRDADVLCLASWWEGMPLTVLEGMASGLAVVATRVGAVPTVLEDGVSGVLVRARSPEELADALALVIADAGLRRSLGAAARARAVERFSLGATVRALDRLYEELAA